MQVSKMFPARKGSHPGKLLDHSPATSISLSKLADESQLGSLSKLLTPPNNNNVTDCSYEGWTPEVPETVTNCSQFETNLHYKSSMPLKKRFRQDFVTDILKQESVEETTKVSSENVTNNNEDETIKKLSTGPLETINVVPVYKYPVKTVKSHSKKNDERKESRATKYRACKGERYKIFMNTTRRTRNKTNRWDLRQKTVTSEKFNFERNVEIQKRITDLPSLEDLDSFNDKPQLRNRTPKKIIKTKRKKRQLSPMKSITSVDNNSDGNITESKDLIDIDLQLKKSVITTKHDNDVEADDFHLKLNGTNNKENGIFNKGSNKSNSAGEDKAANQLEHVDTGEVNIDNFENKPVTVVGSRKRKLRKQNIMRLQPGSTFKDMRVVEDSVVCDLGTLAEVAACSEKKIV